MCKFKKFVGFSKTGDKSIGANKITKLAFAISCIFVNASYAQSNVTVYGVLDTNIEYVNNLSSTTPTAANGFAVGPAKNRVAMMTGGLAGNRWGLRGVEDLGGGLKTVFALESGFALDNGMMQQGNRLFGRQAYVGLDGAFGQVTFGRQYTSIFEAFANFSPENFAGQYDPLIAQVGLNFRSDNTVKYIGKFGGLTAVGHWSFGNGVVGAGEVPGQFRRDTGYGAALTYFGGPWGLTISVDQYNPTLTSAGGTGAFKKAGAAASYSAGPVKLMGGYRWGRNDGSTGAVLLRDDYYWVGANYQATSALSLKLGYYYDNVKNLAGVDIKNPWQASFLVDYSISKRTDIYLTTAYSKNSGLNFDTSAISFANGYFLGSGKSSMYGAAVGIRHIF